jgi:hypothetical protein
MITIIDTLAHVKPGDDDPTGEAGPFCLESNDDARFQCTREAQHIGQHIAGQHGYVADVWPAE